MTELEIILRMTRIAQTRIEGFAKVTGAAEYTADSYLSGTLFAVTVGAKVACGKIKSIDVDRAKKTRDVVEIYTFENMPRLKKCLSFPMGPAGQARPPMQNSKVNYYGESIALVVARTFEAALEASALISAEYQDVSIEKVKLADGDPQRVKNKGLMGKLMSEDSKRGQPEQAIKRAKLIVDAEYLIPRQYAMAMEPHATVASWSADGKLTVREGSQWVDGAQTVFSKWFGIKPDDVRLISNFVGGGFGSKIGVFPHAALAAMAARELKLPVKLILNRTQTIETIGGRPATSQRIRIGATAEGKITGLIHETTNEASVDTLFIETGSHASNPTYAIENYLAENSVVDLNITPPIWMRAPGANPGSFAMESAMDELAVLAQIDPVELRLLNYAEKDPESGKPWATRHLRDAYQAGKKAIGWERRVSEPRALRDGDELIGIGMSTAVFPARRVPSEAFLSVGRDGRVRFESRGTDIGTGSFTVMAIVVSEALGIPVNRVDVKMGTTDFAHAAIAGGSMGAASIGTAAKGAAEDLKKKLLSLAHASSDASLKSLELENVFAAASEILISAKLTSLDVKHRTYPSMQSHIMGSKAFTTLAGISGVGSSGSSVYSWGAHFVEVGVNEFTGATRVRKMVGAFDCGHVLSPVTAHSQLHGALTMGIGMALFEGAEIDNQFGHVANASFENYVVPVHADIPEIEVMFVGEFDECAGPLGSKPLGELGIVGVAAAIANAIYNATGVRHRSLPIKFE